MTMLRTGGWILFVCLAAPSAAQDPDHFGQLIEAIEPGDDIRVTLSGGRASRARVVGVTLETLSVRVGDQQLDLGRDDVWAVRYWVDDPTDDGRSQRGVLRSSLQRWQPLQEQVQEGVWQLGTSSSWIGRTAMTR